MSEAMHFRSVGIKSNGLSHRFFLCDDLKKESSVDKQNIFFSGMQEHVHKRSERLIERIRFFVLPE